MHLKFFGISVVQVKGTTAGELVDGWLVNTLHSSSSRERVLLAAGGTGLKGRGGFVVLVVVVVVVVVVGRCSSWAATTGRLRHRHGSCFRFDAQ